ncbi:unnamed protein product [Pleuronectes platessa]|uniref:Uncharacterized protein n=1 Tax=Pleuronectes platessa TaxID=8262 RepID=A0A9N7UNH7_PLEPL|nr:unnamed protein product [Pleuronectes platessa]
MGVAKWLNGAPREPLNVFTLTDLHKNRYAGLVNLNNLQEILQLLPGSSIKRNDNFLEMEMKHEDIVKSLKNELLSAEAEIKTLKEELRKKEWLIEMDREKSQARTNAYLDCLRAVTETEKEMNICKREGGGSQRG